jgi:hypothetical protein
MKDIVQCRQSRTVIIPFTIVNDAGTPSIGEGSAEMTVADGGAGLYTVTLTRASSRSPIVLVSATTDSTGEEVIANVLLSSISATGFQVEVNDDAGTGVDRTIHGLAIVFENASAR